MRNPRRFHCERNKAYKIDKYLDVKNCSCEKCLFCRSVISCEDEILNTTEKSLVGKKQNPLSKRIPIITLI